MVHLLAVDRLVNLPPLPPAPIYWPFDAGPFRLKLGVKPLDLADWILLDEAYPAELAEKRRLLAECRGDVLVAAATAHAACQELLAVLSAHLCQRFPDCFAVVGDQLHNRLTAESWPMADAALPNENALHPLEQAARLVQEDLCLMQPDDHGVYRLTAACVAFPSRWRLIEKFLRSAAQIHDPVAFYAEQIGAAVDRLLDAVTVERPVWRLNWNLHDSDALFQPAGMGQSGRDDSITIDNAAARLWLRVERQTLRRLPSTQAVLFTIRTFLQPLAHLTGHPTAAAELAAAIRQMPPATFQYKSLPVFADAALAWLDRASEHGSPST